jgi:transposase
MFLSDLQWEMVRHYLPTPPTGPHKRGRPIQDTRMVLEGILWVLKSGARWRDLPHPPYPAYQTCHRYFQRWASCGAFDKIVEILVRDAEAVGWVKSFEAFIDATFVPAKKGGRVPDGPALVRAIRSWPWPTIMDARLPFTWTPPGRAKRPSRPKRLNGSTRGRVPST